MLLTVRSRTDETVLRFVIIFIKEVNIIIIYKITNIINNKCYIGQTTQKDPYRRISRHFTDALHNKLDTKFCRAIRKYGKENFYYDFIDTATTKEELNQKEKYWISYYNSIDKGYNMVEGGIGFVGNSYGSKTKEELEIIKDKIRTSKIGSKNPMARKIKRVDIHTHEANVFDTIISCAQACGIQNGKTSITQRLNGQIASPFKKKWLFEYYNE